MNTSFATFVSARTVLLCSTAVLLATSAQAQQSPEAALAPDEIVVTAQKRVERLADVPLSITAASGEQLAKQGITDTAQLTKLVPGFTFQQGTYGTPVFAIRGIGFFDNSILAGPAVTAYIDQVPLPLSVMTRGATLDIERVEALKGPQGTLFGQNSTGGAINYIAAKPTDTLKAGFDLGYGRFSEVTAGAFVSGPITDTLRARVALRQEYMDGWQQSLTRPGETLGKKHFYNGRILLDWAPTDRFSFKTNISGWQDQSDSLATQFLGFAPSVPVTPTSQMLADALSAAPSNPSNPRAADWDPGIDFARNDKFYLLSLRADWKVTDSINLTSITAYSHLTTDRPIDTDGTAINNFRYDIQDGRVRSFSQELRISGDFDAFKWMLGGNYQRQNGREYQLLNNPATNGILDLGPAGFFNQDASTYLNEQRPTTKSIFGSVDYKLTEQLTAQGSIRYTTENRKFEGCLADAGRDPTATTNPVRDAFAALSSVLSGSPTVIAPFGCITLNDTTAKPELVRRALKENNVAWRTSLNWKPNSDTLLYANVSKGYKAGSFSILPAVFASQFQPVTQESILAYEAGFKVALADRRVQLSGAAFYYDYENKQLVGYYNSGLFGSLPKLINIPKSRVQGAELEATIRPVEGLRFMGGVTYIDSKVKADPVAPNQALDPFLHVISYVGEAFPNTPKWQAVGDAEYEFGLNENLNAFLGGSVTYRSNSFSAFGRSTQFQIPSYALIDLRAGLESKDGEWRVQLWGRNITNKLYVTNVSHLIDSVTRSVGSPATYGATLSYRY
jgi:outer membrane receptor protein involved in Fe transport